jgi:hypothetical protein
MRAAPGSTRSELLLIGLLVCAPLQEFEARFAAWQDNLAYIEEYNAKHTSHWVSSTHARTRCGSADSVGHRDRVAVDDSPHS